MGFVLRFCGTFLLVLQFGVLTSSAADPLSCFQDELALSIWVREEIPRLYDSVPTEQQLKILGFDIQTTVGDDAERGFKRFRTDIVWTDGTKVTSEVFHEKNWSALVEPLIERMRKAQKPYEGVSWEEFGERANAILIKKMNNLQTPPAGGLLESDLARDPEILAIASRIQLPMLEVLYENSRNGQWNRAETMKYWNGMTRTIGSHPWIQDDLIHLLKPALEGLIPNSTELAKQKSLFVRKDVDRIGRATFTRGVDLKNGILYLQGGSLSTIQATVETPSWIRSPEVPELVIGKGVPTHLFVTLHQMRMAGVKRGKLKSVVVDGIANLETLLEVAQTRRFQDWVAAHPGKDFPGEWAAELFLKTASGRYIETVCTQSGHRIKKIEIGDVAVTDFRTTVKKADPPSTRGKKLAEDFAPDAKVPSIFGTMKIELEPLD